MNLIGIFAHHKVAANLLMILMIISGIFALKQLNIQFFPTFALDRVSIRVVWSGASAEDIERGITIPLEQSLKTVDNLNQMTSTSAQNISSIQLEFNEGTNLLIALEKVKQKVAEFRNLPQEAEKPIVESVVRYESVAKIMLSGDLDTQELRILVDDFERDLIRRGIDKVTINGLPKEEIAIEVSTKKLIELGMSLEDVANKIASNSQDLPLGSYADEEHAKELRTLAQRRTAHEFADIPMINTADQYMELADVATIEKRAQVGEVTHRVQGQAVVEMSLLRTENGNALDAANIMEKWLADTRPTLPPGINLEVYDESWRLIKERTMLLLTNGGGGLILVVLILYLFLNAKVAIWVAVGIPVSFMATLAILYGLGGSINMISLFALIMALGIIVDDAIVVGEDALTHYQDGEAPLMAAEGGARRMFIPVLAASLTTVSAFLPLMMVGGIMGNILFDIPLVIICVIIASLIESFFILPGHLRHAFVQIKQDKIEKNTLRERFDRSFYAFRENHFKNWVTRAIENRGITITLSVAIFVLSIVMLISGRIGYSFFPTPESQIIYANVSFVSGTPKSVTSAYLKHMEQQLYATEAELGKGLIDRAISIHGSSFTGTNSSKQGDQLGAIYLELLDPDKRTVRNKDFIKSWESKLNKVAGLDTVSITARKAGPPGTDISVRLQGANTEKLKMAATELSEALKNVNGVYAIENDMPYGKEQLIFELTAAGRMLGLNIKDIGQQLRMAFDGKIVQIFQQGTEEVEVRVLLEKKERETINSLHNVYIHTPKGEFVALETVASWHAKQGFEVLRHSEGDLAIEVQAEVDSTVNKTNLIIENIKKNVLPELKDKYALDYSFEGRSANEKDTMQDMKNGLIIGLSLIYIVLTWIFSSYGWPLIVMSIIPFGLVGAITGHWVMGIDMTLLSLFGFFGLSGIVVNDSIILVSFYKHLLEKGMEPEEALIQASVKRLRAVLLTSLTTIAGLTPLLFETSLQAQFLIPMATSIAFGLMFSTLTVLIIVPVLLSYYRSFELFRKNFSFKLAS